MNYYLNIKGQLWYWEVIEANVIAHFDMDMNRFIVQQFTGLRDKNRKDIYEGDIVYSHFNSTLYVVKWGNYFIYKREDDSEKTECKGYYVESIDGENVEEFDTSDWAELKGNIFENPELLN